MIKNHYMEIDYNGRLPMIVFTDKGWEIERETYANELLNGLYKALDTKDTDMFYALKGKNRSLLLLLLEKIQLTGDGTLIPLLEIWKSIEFKKVQKEIQRVINQLSS